MLNYVIRRVLLMIPTLLAISVLVFVIIQLPPGDIITSRLQDLQAEGQEVSEEQIAALRARYYGGWVDILVQRQIEILMAIPQLPLWMALSASLPPSWPPLRVYFGITIILSLMGWTGLARVVRGKFLSMRDEDFVVAARLSGTGEVAIIFKHLLPSFLSHVITAATLAVPGMILGETALRLQSIPSLTSKSQRLEPIEGSVPSAYALPSGCPFHTRCTAKVGAVCHQQMPAHAQVGPDHYASCFAHTQESVQTHG